MTQFAEVADALIAWARAQLPEIATVHDYPELTDFGPFPDLALDFRRVRTVERGGRLTTAHSQRKQFEAVLSVLVDVQPFRDSAQLLWDFADRLIAAQVKDRTLGIADHGIALDSEPWDCAFAIVQRDDGTQAREMTATVTITVPA